MNLKPTIFVEVDLAASGLSSEQDALEVVQDAIDASGLEATCKLSSATQPISGPVGPVTPPPGFGGI